LHGTSLRIIRRNLPVTIAEPVGFTLMSDLHIGSAATNYDAITRDLEHAKDNGDRINVNGDVFDAILPKDVKRYRPDALDERISGRADVLNAALDLAVSILAPYAKQIDMIGTGNHEVSIEQYHGLDPVQLLVHRLNGECGGHIEHGAIVGFLDYRLDVRGSKHTDRFVIFYHHGRGGNAPVMKGMQDFARLGWIDANVIWLGHRHNRITDVGNIRLRCPESGTDPIQEPYPCVMTGGYLVNYTGDTHEAIMRRGRRSSYAGDKLMAPQAPGGARVVVKVDRKSGLDWIDVQQRVSTR